MNNNRLIIALPKGRLGKEALDILDKCGLPVNDVDVNSRTLKFLKGDIEYLICKPTDVTTFVEYGAADIGIVGKDVLCEGRKDVFELLDLKFGECHFAVAVTDILKDKYIREGIFPLEDFNHKRVATKFTNVAKKYFSSLGMQMDYIKLNGNIELAASIGLADMIVDIVSTGTTLKENNLSEVRHIFNSSARLIGNRVSYRRKNSEIYELIKILEGVTEK